DVKHRRALGQRRCWSRGGGSGVEVRRRRAGFCLAYPCIGRRGLPSPALRGGIGEGGVSCRLMLVRRGIGRGRGHRAVTRHRTTTSGKQAHAREQGGWQSHPSISVWATGHGQHVEFHPTPTSRLEQPALRL